jgi:hypothetical protein
LDLHRLSDADRAEVRSNHDELLASVDVDGTQRAAALIADHADGWHVPWYGTPVAGVRLHFYKGEQALGTIGVGDSFLTAGAAQMLFKEAGEQECGAILDATGPRR